jgi:transposase
VADKGYHSNEVLRDLKRSWRAQLRAGAGSWKAQLGRQANRASSGVWESAADSGVRGKRILEQRGEKLERTFAHMYETGGMRRTHSRSLLNVSRQRSRED